ncbi:c-type cytochrome [Castellaniella sp.]|uniref:c-type cytochrome n=1 Tax=Castellaniella sp. TaxID=1955812 RepID=UPI00356B5505
MSCLNGTDCREQAKRHTALAVLGLMLVIFLLLSAWSFLPSRSQAIPSTIQYGDVDAVAGKRVFQAYNCMGCHTIVGNGAYFGPDLTKIYHDTGPAWLAAFLPSAAGWPTTAAVQVQLQNPLVQQEAGVADIDAYRKQYPGAAERMDHRGGQHSLMPNLPLDAGEITALMAFFKYTSAMHTEGWPPKPDPDRRLPIQAASVAAAASVQAAPAAAADSASGNGEVDLVATGQKLVGDLGCVACHATDQTRMVGPGWGGLFGHEVKLADGSTVVADEEYIVRSIREPDAQVVEGYPPHVMPSYDALVSEADMEAIVAYLRSL